MHNMPEAVKQPSETDQRIAKYIEEQSHLGEQGGCFDPALEGEESLQVFLQLSELRTGLVSWYDFGEGASVLEIGAGFGALTGRLCGRDRPSGRRRWQGVCSGLATWTSMLGISRN